MIDNKIKERRKRVLDKWEELKIKEASFKADVECCNRLYDEAKPKERNQGYLTWVEEADSQFQRLSKKRQKVEDYILNGFKGN